MTVHVDSTRHHDHAASVDRAIDRQVGAGRLRDDLIAFDPQIAHLAVDIVGRIVDGAAGDFDEVGHLGSQLHAEARRRRELLCAMKMMFASTEEALAGLECLQVKGFSLLGFISQDALSF